MSSEAILPSEQQSRESKNVAISAIEYEKLGALDEALKDSIEHIGLLHPIVVAPNLDKKNEKKPYKLIAGKSRLKVFLELKKTEIPSTLLEFEESDEYEKTRRILATNEENLLRKNLPILELCEILGRCKKAYEELYPETVHGANSPKRDPETGTLPYILKAAKNLGKSKSTIGDYLQIWKELIDNKDRHKKIKELKTIRHPILESKTDLLRLIKYKENSFDNVIYQLVNRSNFKKEPPEYLSLYEALHISGLAPAKKSEKQSDNLNPQPNTNSDEPKLDEPDNHVQLDSPSENLQGKNDGDFPQNGQSPNLDTNAQSKSDRESQISNPNFQPRTLSFPTEFALFYDEITACLHKSPLVKLTNRFEINVGEEEEGITVGLIFNGLEAPKGVNLPKECQGFGLYLDTEDHCQKCKFKEKCVEAFDLWIKK